MAIWSQRSLRTRRSATRPLVPLAASIRIEELETRTLLSAVLPGLNDHGLTIGNAAAAGQAAVVVDGSQNAKLSNNDSGSGLFINLNNQSGQLNALKRLTIRDVTVANNANAGVQIHLANLTLDSLVINRSAIQNNGGSGLYFNFSNVTIKKITIWDNENPLDPEIVNVGNTTFSDNAFDGLHVLAKNSTISNLRVLGTVAQNNAGHGMLFDLDNVRVPTVLFDDNEVVNNTAGSGIHFATNRAVIGTGSATLVNNTVTGNSSHGLSFVSQSLLPGSVPTASPTRIKFAGINDNNFSSNAGSGISVDLRQQAAWDARILRNTISSNQLRGFDLKAIDTESAFDLQIGSNAINPQQQLIDGNTFDANIGAAISIELNDSSGALNNTTGRFRILGNTITNSVAAAGSFVYLGQGIHISARGDVTRQNGAARYFQSTIDRNIITGNEGDGVLLNITEDSELIDLTIGNATGRQQTFDINGAFAGGGNVPTVAGDGNLISGNGGNGISLLRRSSSYIKNVRILDNTISTNAGEGVYVQASNSYVTVPNAARPNLAIVTDVSIERNTIQGNALNGVHARTELDAVLLVNLRYNRIDGNVLNGVRVTGLENNIADFENVGGTWIKNAITNNGVGLDAGQVANGHGNGIRIEGVVGSVNPLLIGRLGTDTVDGQSFGNFIAGNGEDGIEIGARPGAGGTVTPRDIRDAVEIVNNAIVNNGRNAIGSPYTAGKGIDIELVASVVLNRSGQTREFRIDRNIIQGNAGDGIEVNNRGGQLRLTGQGNFIDLNGGRGVDLLNQAASAGTDAEAYVRFGGPNAAHRNFITNNGLEGFYVVNTPSPGQTQDVEGEETLVTWAISGSRIEAVTTVNLVLDFENNEVRDNGSGISQFNSPASTLSGTGLVVRAGSQYSAGNWSTIADLTGYADPFSTAAAAGVGTNGFGSGGSVERDYRVSANGRVNARIVDNEFSGNGGDDVFLEGYTALLPRTTAGEWNQDNFRNISAYDRDPLARLNVEFHGNTGDSLDVVRTQSNVDGQSSSYTNGEADFKSRTSKTAPNVSGPFGNNAGRNRVVSRVADRGAGGGSLEDAYNADPRLGFTGTADFYTAPGSGPNVSSSGTAMLIAEVNGLNANGPIVVTTQEAHGLSTGDLVTISGTGMTNANGVHMVRVISTTQVELYVPTDVNSLFFFGGTLVPVPGQGFSTTGSGTILEHNANKFQFDGLGPSTLRIENNWDVSGFGDLEQGDNFDEVWSEGSSPIGIGWNGVVANTFSFLTAEIGDVTVNETDGTAFLTVTLSEAAGPGGVRIWYKTTDGSAMADPNNDGNTIDGDYVPVTEVQGLSVVVAAGSNTVQIPITIRNDTAFDEIEQFYVDLYRISDGDFVDSRGIVTILPDGDGVPVISVDDMVVDEVTGKARVRVSLSNASSQVVSVDYTTVDGIALAGVDYADRSGTITFAPGETEQFVEVTLITDRIAETDETFRIDLSNADKATLLDNSGTVSIRDTRYFSVTDVQVVEGDFAVVTIGLNEPLPVGVTMTVDYVLQNGTATSGIDFEGQFGTLTFVAGGPTSQTIQINTIADGLDFEGDETFTVELSNATIESNGQTHVDVPAIAKASGLVTIIDAFEAESAAAFDHEVGSAEPDGWSASGATDSRGFLLHGKPKTGIPGGLQTAVFRMLTSNTSAGNHIMARIDVYDANTGRILAQRMIRRHDFVQANVYTDFTLPFENFAGSALELRVEYLGVGYVKADSVRLSTAGSPALVLEAETDLANNTGRAFADGWVAIPAHHDAGYISMGPGTSDVPHGPQSATFRLRAQGLGGADRTLVTISVFDSESRRNLAQKTIRKSDFFAPGEYQEFVLDFLSSPGQRLQFRTHWADESIVWLDKVIVSQNPAQPLINFEAESDDFTHDVGHRNADGWAADTATYDKGWLASGTGTTEIPGGAHAAVFRLLVDGTAAANARMARIEVFVGGQVQARRIIRANEFNDAYQYQNFAVSFTNATGELVEFKTWWFDEGFVQLDSVAVVDAPSPQLHLEAESDVVAHQTGSDDGNGGWTAVRNIDSAGYLADGTGTTVLPGGQYTADFRLKIDNLLAPAMQLGRIQVVDVITGSVLAQQVLTRGMFSQANVYESISLTFNTNSTRTLAFRTEWFGNTTLTQDYVNVLPSNFNDSELDVVFEGVDELLLVS